jgi:hypothetical protein
VQLPPELAGTVAAEVLAVDPSDLGLQLGVAAPAGRGGRWRAAWSVEGAIGSSSQIGSTPNRSL